MHISVWLNHPVVEYMRFSDQNRDKLKELIPDIEVSVHKSHTTFKESLEYADIALVWIFNQKWFALAKKLKWIALPSAGLDYIHLDLPKDIILTNSSFHGEFIAETVLGAMLGFSRGLFWSAKNQKNYTWPRAEIVPYLRPLKGSHLVILGFGNIGTRIANLAKPFGVRITGIKRTLIGLPDFLNKDEDKIITLGDMDKILPEADHFVVVLPRDKSTDDIINKERLDLLHKHAYIYNVGRGNAIEENALAEVLKTNRIKGAYLDVFKNEPLEKDSPLRECSNLLMTPHSSAWSPTFFDLFIDEFVLRYKEWIKNT
jgi:phosphoglycerate dehydrogenase-like enzyme